MPFTPALAQRLFPSRTIAREMLVVLAGAGLITLLAQLRIEVWPVPITGQTLGVLLAGALLGFRRGTLATALYVGSGLAGLPVFAGTGVGLIVLKGMTGGYLIGFLLSAGVIGLLAEHGFLQSYGRAMLAMAIATVPVFVLGVAWLLHFRSPREALYGGFLLFVPGACIKIAIASWISVRMGRRRA